MDIKVLPLKDEELKPLFTDSSSLGFGREFTDRMFTMEFAHGEWIDPTIKKYENLSLDPAAIVFHYAQEIFEGLKAYYRADGKIGMFRPDENMKRMNRSAERLCMPTFDGEAVLDAIIEMVKLEKRWIPKERGCSLYVRPTMIATEAGLGVRASDRYLFFVILSPVSYYFPQGFKPISLAVTKSLVRAVPGGTGEAKCGGNYASTLMAGKVAKDLGYSQVLWTDGVEHKYLEEVGAMNFFICYGDTIVTPQLDGSILPGITRKSVVELARHLGYEVEERKISLDEVWSGIDTGKLTEAFGSGTAAVISPVGTLYYDGAVRHINDEKVGKVTQHIYDELLKIQYGEADDPFGWARVID